MGKADLHIHSTASDGKASPTLIVEMAVEQNLNIIALTDHDTIAGYKEAQRAAEDKPIEILSGAEITAHFEGREAHLLAYCFDTEDPQIVNLLIGHKKARYKRGKWILKQLSKQGLEVDMNEVKAEARGSNIGRPHIAAVLVEKGYVGSQREAFIRYLSNQRLGTIPSDYVTVKEAIAIVKKAGGAVVLAHPGQMYDEKELDRLVDAGIDGLEVLHPSHNYEIQKSMEAYAQKHNLLVTGGSDFHGANSDYQKYFGVITISMDKVHALTRLTDQRKKMKVS